MASTPSRVKRSRAQTSIESNSPAMNLGLARNVTCGFTPTMFVPFIWAPSLFMNSANERALSNKLTAHYLWTPEEPSVLYNVAFAYALLGELDKCLDCLEKALGKAFGYRDWIENDLIAARTCSE